MPLVVSTRISFMFITFLSLPFLIGSTLKRLFPCRFLSTNTWTYDLLGNGGYVFRSIGLFVCETVIWLGPALVKWTSDCGVCKPFDIVFAIVSTKLGIIRLRSFPLWPVCILSVHHHGGWVSLTSRESVLCVLPYASTYRLASYLYPLT